MTRAKLVGTWRIVEMELWDTHGRGSFRFIAVEGWIDVRPADHLGPTGVEFSWDGKDEMDDSTGRGWARLTDEGDLLRMLTPGGGGYGHALVGESRR